MTHPESVEIITGIDAALRLRMTPAEIAETAKAWAWLFADHPAEVVRKAATIVLSTHEFNTLPAPAKVLAAVNAMRTSDDPPAMAAWGLVLEAVVKYGRYAEAEGLASLPPRAAHVARSMGWRSFCDAENDSIATIRAQFLHAYDAEAEHETARLALPSRRQHILAATEYTRMLEATP